MTTADCQITAAQAVDALSLPATVAGSITASTESRTLTGDLVRYAVCRAVGCSCCTYGRTSVGRLKVQPGALRWPTPIDRVKLTREHDRDTPRGHVAAVVDDPRPGQLVSVRASCPPGPDGDAALSDATHRLRDGFSFDVIDAAIEGDSITDALVIAVGQVAIPAFDDMRVTRVAASQTATAPAGQNKEGSTMLTPEEAAELSALAALPADQLDDAQRARLAELVGRLTPATEPEATASEPPAPASSVAASLHGGPVPTGVGTRPATRTSQDSALTEFTRTIVAALSPGGGGAAAITAALSDVTHSGAGAAIEAPAWSGELWSGVEYQPIWTDLFNAGALTNYEGHGWRFTQKPVIADYAGDKAAIPSGPITTEPTTYEAARMAVGHDIDRKFYDFPNEGFLRAYVEAVRESWAIQLDAKVAAYAVANAVAVGGAASTSLLNAAARAVRSLHTRRAGRASFVVVSEADIEDLMDVSAQSVPAFLSLFNIDPSNWRVAPADQLAGGTVLAGVRQAATVRTLPGSPIRVSAQHIANGGIDEAFFGYWAIEEHHTSGVASVAYTAPA